MPPRVRTSELYRQLVHRERKSKQSRCLSRRKTHGALGLGYTATRPFPPPPGNSQHCGMMAYSWSNVSCKLNIFGYKQMSGMDSKQKRGH